LYGLRDDLDGWQAHELYEIYKMKTQPDWLNKEVLARHVDGILELSQRKRDVHTNVVDPFAVLFESALGGFNENSYKSQELHRQLQKAVENKIGALHQEVLGSIQNFKSTGAIGGGVDIVSERLKVIAEIKNKHNTVKGSNLYKEIYCNLDRYLSEKKYQGYTAYYVTIIPKKGQEGCHTFRPSISREEGKAPERKDILQIDGRGFYKLATGREDAIEHLFSSILSRIEEKHGVRSQQLKFASNYFQRAFPV
jgi:hypothetical protein